MKYKNFIILISISGGVKKFVYFCIKCARWIHSAKRTISIYEVFMNITEVVLPYWEYDTCDMMRRQENESLFKVQGRVTEIIEFRNKLRVTEIMFNVEYEH